MNYLCSLSKRNKHANAHPHFQCKIHDSVRIYFTLSLFIVSLITVSNSNITINSNRLLFYTTCSVLCVDWLVSCSFTTEHRSKQHRSDYKELNNLLIIFKQLLLITLIFIYKCHIFLSILQQSLFVNAQFDFGKSSIYVLSPSDNVRNVGLHSE